MPALSTAARNTLASSVVYSARSTGSYCRLDAPGLDPRKIEQRVHQLAEPQGVPVGQGQRVAMRLREVGIREQLFDRTEHQGERRAEFVADVREKDRLRPVQFGQRLGAPALFLERARIGDRRRNVLRRQREERPVGIVELAARADAGDDDAVGAIGAGPVERQEQRRVRRFGIRPARERPAEANREIPCDLLLTDGERGHARPRAMARIDRQRRRCRRMVRRDPGRGHEPGGPSARDRSGRTGRTGHQSRSVRTRQPR
jgi:hypothetical protein